MKNTVIAMAYGGEPLVRSAVGKAERVIYLTAPDVEVTRDAEYPAVGFPREYIFEHDESLFAKLDKAYREANRSELTKLWGMAHRWEPT